MLQTLQRWIEGTYRLEPQASVSDFLIDRRLLEDHLPEGHPYRRAEEVVLVAGEAPDLHLGLYFHSALRAEGACLGEAGAHQVSTLLEGVSHLLLVIHRLQRREGLTQLELELQAEVDKYLFLSLVPEAGLAEEAKVHLRRPADLQGLDEGRRETYEAARRLAYRYCLSLERRYLAPRSFDGLYRELRHFYRLSHWQKLHCLGTP
jgi:hypothetical protein